MAGLGMSSTYRPKQEYPVQGAYPPTPAWAPSPGQFPQSNSSGYPQSASSGGYPQSPTSGGTSQRTSPPASSVDSPSRQAVPPGPQKTTIVMVGPTGQGKSTLGNIIAGSTVFGTSDDFDSETIEAAHSDFTKNQRQYRVIDTIGFLDTRMGAAENMDKFAGFADRSPGGIDTFLFVLKKGRFTEEAMGQLQAFEAVAGSAALQHTVLVFTHCGSETNEALQQRCITSSNQHLKRATEHVKGVVGVESQTKDPDRNDLAAVLAIVEQVISANDGKKYENSTLLEARRRREELQEIILSLTPERREAMQAKLDGLFYGRSTFEDVHRVVTETKARDAEEQEAKRKFEEERAALSAKLAAALSEATAWKEVAKDVLGRAVKGGQNGWNGCFSCK